VYVELADPVNDFFILSNDTLFAAAGSSAACQAACSGDAACILLRINADGTSCGCTVRMLLALAQCHSRSMAVWTMCSNKLTAGVDVGTTLTGGSSTQASLAACEALCSPLGECEGFTYSGTTCKLFKSDLDIDWTGFYHVSGTKLKSYVA